MLLALTCLLLAAPVPAPAPNKNAVGETASVLLERARVLDEAFEKAWLETYRGLAPEGATATPTAKGIEIAGIGTAHIVARDEALVGAEAAFRRGITPLISDEKLAAHSARLDIELVPKPGVAMGQVMDALVALASAACQVSAGTAVYFASGNVLHPATYVAALARDRLPRGWLWVGFELGGTTTQLTFTSIGLAKIGMMELRLSTARRDVGAAIETFLDLVTMALARGSDFPDGHAFARTKSAPLIVKQVPAEKLWTIDYAR